MRGDVFLARLSLWRCSWHSIIAEALGARAHMARRLRWPPILTTRTALYSWRARHVQARWIGFRGMWSDVEWCGCVDCGLPVRTGRWQLWKSSVQGRAMNRPLGLNFWPIPIWMWDAAGAQSSLVSSGHMVANASLAAQTTKAGWLSGQFSGVEQYKQPGLASWMFRISRMSQKNL